MARALDRYFFLSLVVSTGPITVLLNAIAGTYSNSLMTGSFIVISTAALAFSSIRQWRTFVPNLCDAAFVMYLCCVAVSFWLNGINDSKEAALLILTLAAYPACRLFAGEGIKPSFIAVTIAIVAVGAVATGFELIKQWNNTYEKPILFGTFAAGGSFLNSLGFAMFALLCVKTTPRQRLWAAAIIIPSIVIFAAAMVRLSFVAILATLILAAMLSTGRRIWIAGSVLLLLGVVSVGLLARSEKTLILTGYAVNAFHEMASAELQALPAINDAKLPSCSTLTSGVDTIGIRRALLRDAIVLIKRTGSFGIGLNGFMKQSCIADTEVHNSFLQAIIEFGWAGGLAFIALVCFAGFRLLPVARSNPEAMFALYGLTFILVMSLGSGRTSRDAVLFAFLGIAASIRPQSHAQKS